MINSKILNATRGHFLGFFAAFNDVLAIICVSLIFFYYQFAQWGVLTWLGNLGTLIMILIFSYFVFKEFVIEGARSEIINFILLSIILMLVSLSKLLQSSTLFTSLIFGIMVANLKKTMIKKIYLAVLGWEKPLNFIMLFFLGTVISFNGEVRFAILLIFLLLSVRWVLNRFFYNQAYAFVIGVSSLSLAIAIDVFLTTGNRVLLPIVLLLFLATNLSSVFLCKKETA